MRVPFGKYQLIATLGRGGMADVYLAAMAGPVGFRKLVVIKRIRDDVVDRLSYTTMLLEEAQLAARLQHPNVVQTLEVGVHEGQHYIAMEYLDGQPLAQILQVGGRPGHGFATRVMADALAGLEYAHTLADYDGRPLLIVHRDVSPQNLFVTYAGEVKVVDFGVAKTSIQVAGHTEAGIIKGKVGYMAPEQLSEGTVDRRTDVFAAGIVFWELLTGRRLFKGGHEVESIAKVLFQPIPPPSTIAPHIPPVLEAACLRALERDPSRRWQSAGEMREALYRYMESEAGGLRRDEVGRYVVRLFERERDEVRARVTEFMAESEDGSTDGDPGALGTLRISRAQSRSLPPHDAEPSGARASTAPPPGARASTAPPYGPHASAVAPTGPHASAALPSGAQASAVAPTGPHASAAAPTGPHASAAPPYGPTTPSVATGTETRRPLRWRILAAGVAAVGLFGGAAITNSVWSGPQPRPSRTTTVVPAPPPERPPLAEPAITLEGSGTLGVEAVPLMLEGFFKKRGASAVRREKGKRADDVLVVATTSGGEESILVRSEGTSGGFECLAERTCDIAMAAREIRAAEADQLMAKGIGDVRSAASEHVIALDGIAVVVHPSNALRSLDLAQVATIFTGGARDWSAVGGSPGPVAIMAHEDGSGTLDVFSSIALGGRPLVSDAKRLPDNARIADAVAVEPNAVGFLGLSFVRGARALAIGDRGITPMIPSAFTVSTEKYLLSRRLYLYTSAKPKPLALDLLDYVLSDSAVPAIRAAGFIDLGVSLKNAEPCASCPPRYAAATKRARRLSLDFRFRPGMRELDARATRDVDRVVRFVREHPTARLLLFGFCDASGEPRSDQKRSRELAQAIDAELGARGLRAAIVEGFGGEMPVATNTTELGRTKNRRVEIWLQDR